jgi:hypothetical protein
MGSVQRGVVKGSNKEGKGGDGRSNGFLPLGGGAGAVSGPNQTHSGDRRGGTAPLGGQAGTIHPPDHRFNVDQAQMPQPPSAVEPGKGAVPVNPFQTGPGAAKTMPIADMPKGK